MVNKEKSVLVVTDQVLHELSCDLTVKQLKEVILLKRQTRINPKGGGQMPAINSHHQDLFERFVKILADLNTWSEADFINAYQVLQGLESQQPEEYSSHLNAIAFIRQMLDSKSKTSSAAV